MNQLATNEYLELKALLLQQQAILLMLIPAKASIARIAEITGKTRQAIRKYLLKNFEPEVDFWMENDKIIVSREAVIQIISRGVK